VAYDINDDQVTRKDLGGLIRKPQGDGKDPGVIRKPQGDGKDLGAVIRKVHDDGIDHWWPHISLDSTASSVAARPDDAETPPNEDPDDCESLYVNSTPGWPPGRGHDAMCSPLSSAALRESSPISIFSDTSLDPFCKLSVPVNEYERSLVQYCESSPSLGKENNVSLTTRPKTSCRCHS